MLFPFLKEVWHIGRYCGTLFYKVFFEICHRSPFRQGENMSVLTIKASIELLDRVTAFVDEQLEAHGCSMKAQMQIDIAVEEIFVNIASYAYAPGEGDATISVEFPPSCTDAPEKPCVLIRFEDSGVPFNPLLKADPDVTLSAEERAVGGLGIFMVKQNMDALEYIYRDGKNILTMRKYL